MAGRFDYNPSEHGSSLDGQNPGGFDRLRNVLDRWIERRIIYTDSPQEEGILDYASSGLEITEEDLKKFFINARSHFELSDATRGSKIVGSLRSKMDLLTFYVSKPSRNGSGEVRSLMLFAIFELDSECRVAVRSIYIPEQFLEKAFGCTMSASQHQEVRGNKMFVSDGSRTNWRTIPALLDRQFEFLQKDDGRAMLMPRLCRPNEWLGLVTGNIMPDPQGRTLVLNMSEPEPSGRDYMVGGRLWEPEW